MKFTHPIFEDLKEDFNAYTFFVHRDKVLFFEKVRNRMEAHRELILSHMSTLPFRPIQEDIITYRNVYYNAILLNPQGWEDFLIDELKFLVERQERHPNLQDQDVECIYNIATTPGIMDRSYYKRCIEVLMPRITSDIPFLKRYAFQAICTMHHQYSYDLNTQEINSLQRCLEVSTWNDKMVYYTRLKELNLLPNHFSVTLWDRIVGWFDSM